MKSILLYVQHISCFLSYNLSFCSVKGEISCLLYSLPIQLSVVVILRLEFVIFTFLMYPAFLFLFHFCYTTVDSYFCLFYFLIFLNTGQVFMLFLSSYRTAVMLFLFYIICYIVEFCCSWSRSWQIWLMNVFQIIVMKYFR